jgi:outer membrane protein OmpA-like peptidoglycan-associated protein
MRRSRTPFAARRFLSRAALFAVVLAVPSLGGVALAQPADDPGLAEPTPTPTPAPTPPPAPTKPTPAPSKPTTSTIKSSTAVSSPPMFAPAAPAPEVKETVDVQTTYVDEKGGAAGPKESDAEFSERLAAPTIFGPVGLFRIMTAEPARRHNFRIGLHLYGFQESNFLIAGSGGAKGDTNGRVSGDLTIGYTPWKYIEIYLGVYNSSNRNQRTDPGRTDPEVILSMGDLGLGLKGRYTVARFIDLGLHLGVKFLNSVSGISFDGSSTNFSADAIVSFDLRRAPKTEKVPLRFHVNFGFLLDNSLSLLPAGQCARSTGNDACIRSRVVQTFAYGIGTNRFRIGLAADVPLVVRGVGINPFLEYWANTSVGGGDQTILNALRNDPAVAGGRLTNFAQQWMTIGLRLRPVAGLILDLGVDVGLQSPGFQYGPPVAPWQVLAGAAYAFDPLVKASKTKVVTKTITREIARGIPTGKVRGVVRDAVTKKPIPNATIRYVDRRDAVTPQLTADDGTFVSYGFAPGPVAIEVSRDDYHSVRVETSVVANGETPAEVQLQPKPPAAGQVRVKVNDDKGGAVPATVRFTSTSGAIVDADAEAPGAFVAKLPADDYTVDVVAEGYLAKQRQVTVTAGQVQSLDVVLTKKPAVSRVSLGKGEIVVKGVVHFGTNNAEIKLDGQQLLDEVADVIIRNPQLRRIRVEGHTDNRGSPQKNLELSKARANAVRDYLIKQGVDPSRLEAEGYGASQPLVPNLTPANRARNRRVAFKILDVGSSGPVSPL